jgi:hypothetical protein
MNVYIPIEDALRALVGLLVIEMLVAHCSASACTICRVKGASHHMRSDYSTVFFLVCRWLHDVMVVSVDALHSVV